MDGRAANTHLFCEKHCADYTALRENWGVAPIAIAISVVTDCLHLQTQWPAATGSLTNTSLCSASKLACMTVVLACRCVDLDGDGIITPREMWFFYGGWADTALCCTDEPHFVHSN